MQFDHFAGEYKQLLDQTVAVSGEDSEYFAEYKARYLARLFRGRDCGKILDFGCGVGLLSGFLERSLHPSRLDGYDLSGESIRQVDDKLSARGLFTSDAHDLPYDYDLIVVANVMHHVEIGKRLELIQELGNRLAAGGKLVIFEHNPANPVTRWVVEKCPFDKDAILLSPSETRSYLQKSGLAILRRDYIVFMPRILAWLRPLEPGLAWLPLGAQYAIVSEKHA